MTPPLAKARRQDDAPAQDIGPRCACKASQACWPPGPDQGISCAVEIGADAQGKRLRGADATAHQCAQPADEQACATTTRRMREQQRLHEQRIVTGTKRVIDGRDVLVIEPGVFARTAQRRTSRRDHGRSGQGTGRQSCGRHNDTSLVDGISQASIYKRGVEEPVE